MSQPGLGVLINALCGDGGKTKVACEALLGKRIDAIKLEDADRNSDGMLLVTAAGVQVKLHDNGRSCCESRYMTCDDDLPSFVGAEIRDIEVADGPDLAVKAEGATYDPDPHETQFLRIITDRGVITVVTHNEHNGYYGGFSLSAEIVS